MAYRRTTPEIPAGLTVPHDPTNPRDPRNPGIFQLGTEPTGRGTEIREIDPDCCPNGHSLTYPYVTRGWTPCACRGHRHWTCWHPAGNGRCFAEVHWPPVGPDCHQPRNYGARSGP